MRRLLAASVLGLGLVAGLGCTHETCDCEKPLDGGCCPRDICDHHCGPEYAKPAAHAPKPEEIKPMPMPMPEPKEE